MLVALRVLLSRCGDTALISPSTGDDDQWIDCRLPFCASDPSRAWSGSHRRTCRRYPWSGMATPTCGHPLVISCNSIFSGEETRRCARRINHSLLCVLATHSRLEQALLEHRSNKILDQGPDEELRQKPTPNNEAPMMARFVTKSHWKRVRTEFSTSRRHAHKYLPCLSSFQDSRQPWECLGLGMSSSHTSNVRSQMHHRFCNCVTHLESNSCWITKHRVMRLKGAPLATSIEDRMTKLP